jgi:hypothetical protein
MIHGYITREGVMLHPTGRSVPGKRTTAIRNEFSHENYVDVYTSLMRTLDTVRDRRGPEKFHDLMHGVYRQVLS